MSIDPVSRTTLNLQTETSAQNGLWESSLEMLALSIIQTANNLDAPFFDIARQKTTARRIRAIPAEEIRLIALRQHLLAHLQSANQGSEAGAPPPKRTDVGNYLTEVLTQGDSFSIEVFDCLQEFPPENQLLYLDSTLKKLEEIDTPLNPETHIALYAKVWRKNQSGDTQALLRINKVIEKLHLAGIDLDTLKPLSQEADNLYQAILINDEREGEDVFANLRNCPELQELFLPGYERSDTEEDVELEDHEENGEVQEIIFETDLPLNEDEELEPAATFPKQ